MYETVQHIKLGKLPWPEKLLELRSEGFNQLINVSGIDLFQLYSEEQLSPFTIKQHSFKDIFSKAPQLGNGILGDGLIDGQAYVVKSTEEDRQAFYDAVIDVLDLIKAQTPFYIFCHQGIGRSPCVLFTALVLWYGEDRRQILNVIKFLNARAAITSISYSAEQWFAAEFNQKESP